MQIHYQAVVWSPFCNYYLWISVLFVCHTPTSALAQAAGGATEASGFQFPDLPVSNPHTIMRAWTCHGRNQYDMVDRLRQAGIIRNEQVKQVMEKVDRKHYVANISQAYQDTPISIGLGQTISAPHMHAHVLEEILPYVVSKSGAASANYHDGADEPVKFLDVGCGSGYLTACLGRWVHPMSTATSATASGAEDGKDTTSSSTILGRTGQVFGIDIFPHLVQMTQSNIMECDQDLMYSKTVQLKVANGWKGLPEEAPFDAIHVGAAAAEFPKELASQLKVGGVLIVPIGPQQGAQALYKVERIAQKKDDFKFEASDYRLTELLGVRYVPLIEQPLTS